MSELTLVTCPRCDGYGSRTEVRDDGARYVATSEAPCWVCRSLGACTASVAVAYRMAGCPRERPEKWED